MRRSSLGTLYRCRYCKTKWDLPDAVIDDRDLQKFLDEQYEDRLEAVGERQRLAAETAATAARVIAITFAVIGGIVLLCCLGCSGLAFLGNLLPARRPNPPVQQQPIPPPNPPQHR
jgi:hypothetical protein